LTTEGDLEKVLKKLSEEPTQGSGIIKSIREEAMSNAEARNDNGIGGKIKPKGDDEIISDDNEGIYLKQVVRILSRKII
jgi:hypothetical protein